MYNGSENSIKISLQILLNYQLKIECISRKTTMELKQESSKVAAVLQCSSKTGKQADVWFLCFYVSVLQTLVDCEVSIPLHCFIWILDYRQDCAVTKQMESISRSFQLSDEKSNLSFSSWNIDGDILRESFKWISVKWKLDSKWNTALYGTNLAHFSLHTFPFKFAVTVRCETFFPVSSERAEREEERHK